ncbi:hypothetical protein ScPMuIL_009533 [Solemya velum]
MLLYSKDVSPHGKEIEDSPEKSSNDDSNQICSECGEVFSSCVALDHHRLSCGKLSSTYWDPVSEKYRYKSDDSRNEEISDDCEDDSGEYKCQLCPKSFQWKANLIRHQVFHDNNKNYQCENCDKVFTDPSNLQRHIRSQHLGARSHTCTECGKTFSTSSGLKQHQHIHSSVKPFQCEVCLKAYTQFSNLCRHKRMHADCRQQIKCKDCGQAFSTVTSLSKHKRFCEGALRNGIHCGFGGSKLPHLSPSNHVSPMNASMFIGLYGSRTPYPFCPPTAPTFPVLPTSNPFAALTAPVPSSESQLSVANHLRFQHGENMSHIKSFESSHHLPYKHDGSESSGLSSGSEIDTGSGSDAESESSESHEPVRPTFKKERDTEVITPPENSAKFDVRPLNLPQTLPTNKEQNAPFDLSKPTGQVRHMYNSNSNPHSPKNCISAFRPTEQPLDLSKKIIKEPSPSETTHKTHIFGHFKPTRCPSPPPPPPPPPQPKPNMQFSYPHFASPFVSKEMYDFNCMGKFQPTLNHCSKFLPYPTFPMTEPTYAAAAAAMASMSPFGMIPQCANKDFSPVAKMTKLQDQFPFSSPANRMKERYSCKFCGKIFPRSANLTRHLRTHTGEQPYKCKYCERSFSISSNLQRHVRNIHNKEKPFKCPLCDRCFGQQTNLDRHLKKHETDGPDVIDSPVHEQEKDDIFFPEVRKPIATDLEDNVVTKIVVPEISDEHYNGELLNDISDTEEGREIDIVDDEPKAKRTCFNEHILNNNSLKGLHLLPNGFGAVNTCVQTGYSLDKRFAPVPCPT